MAVWVLKMMTAGSPGQAYNLGSPEGITLEKLAQSIARHFDPRPEIRLNASGSSSHATTIFVPDVTLAMTNLGVTVKVPLETAIERTIQWNRACAPVAARVA